MTIIASLHAIQMVESGHEVAPRAVTPGPWPTPVPEVSTVTKPTPSRGARKLTPDAVAYIRAHPEISKPTLARQFGVHVNTIYRARYPDPPRPAGSFYLDELTQVERGALRARLMKHVLITDTCWLWRASTVLGYGRISVRTPLQKHSSRLAYRVLYELDHGEVKAGLQLDHLCRNPLCVNPEHLEPVTPLVNTRRAMDRNVNARKTHCPQGHPYDAENTRVSQRGDGTTFRVCHTCSLDGLHRRRAAQRRLRLLG